MHHPSTFSAFYYLGNAHFDLAFYTNPMQVGILLTINKQKMHTILCIRFYFVNTFINLFKSIYQSYLNLISAFTNTSLKLKVLCVNIT